jgi:hypothetical protein
MQPPQATTDQPRNGCRWLAVFRMCPLVGTAGWELPLIGACGSFASFQIGIPMIPNHPYSTIRWADEGKPRFRPALAADPAFLGWVWALGRKRSFDGQTPPTPVRQCGLNIPNLPPAKAENLAGYTASSATQCRSNPVSGRSLPKTGIFQISAGDYRRFRSRSGQFRSPETDSQFAKARHWRAFLRLLRAKSPGAGLPG